MKVELRYERDDFNTGTSGWLVNSIGKKDITNYDFYPCSTAELLTHDILEHPYRFTPVCDELAALGAYLAHRGYIGDEETRNNVSNDVQYAIETMQEYSSISSRNSKIRDYLESNIWYGVDTNYKDIDIEDKLLKKVIYSFIAFGYNRVKGIEKKYVIDFYTLYLTILGAMESVIKEDPESIFFTDKLVVDIDIIRYSVSVYRKKPIDFWSWEEDFKRYWREERVIYRG